MPNGQQEAAIDTHPTFFSAWRPSLGYVGVVALALQFVAFPVIEALGVMSGHQVTIPRMDLSSLITLITGLLGLSGLRSLDKFNNVAAG